MKTRTRVPGFILGCALLLGAASAFAQSSVTVSTADQLKNAVADANAAGGSRTILVADGTYQLSDTLYVNSPNVTLTSASGKRDAVIIQGDAMSSSAKVKNLIRVSASNFTLSNLTLRRSGWHLLQVAGEQNADAPKIRNVVFRDAYEQMLKVSIDQSNYSITSDNGVIEDCLFEYTAGIGPQYYIGGIDVHGGKNWVVRGNTFKGIASPINDPAEFAIHFWNQSADALVERNIIINSDRAIGFGLDNRGNSRGIIRNNFIYHANNSHPAADTAIYLEASPNTQVYNNTVFMENSYPRSIEYRLGSTTGVLIVNNLTNKPIGARDGASGTLGNNVENAAKSWFVNASAGDLHLASAVSGVVDAGRAVSGLTNDIDGNSRSGSPDIGADEYGASTVKPNPPTNVTVQ